MNTVYILISFSSMTSLRLIHNDINYLVLRH